MRSLRNGKEFMEKLRDEVLSEAEKRGRVVSSTGPIARDASYDHKTGRVVLQLANDCVYAFPTALVEDLQRAVDSDLAVIEIDGAGFNLHWPRLNVDLYVPALVAGIFGTKAWMTREFARMAGSAKSERKASASRSNGAKGGRPRKIAMP